MSRARRNRKAASLLRRVIHLCQPRVQGDWHSPWLMWDSPQECIAQYRHERRVFGHEESEDCCTPEHVSASVLWNDPARLWMGEGPHGYGPRYHRRYLNRRGRNR